MLSNDLSMTSILSKTKQTTYVLIDFDNLFTQKIEDYSIEGIEIKLKAIISDLIQSITIGEIHIRLYGGWYSKGTLTNRASILQQKIAQLNIFPIISSKEKKNILGSIELAVSLISLPSLVWENTSVERSGVRQFRIADEALGTLCRDESANCPVKLLRKFTKSRSKMCHIDGCNLTNGNVFKEVAQKMVDNMIACDFLTLCSDNSVSNVVVVSDDTDHFPSYALGALTAHSANNITIAFSNASSASNWQSILQTSHMVKIKTLTNEN